MFVLSNLLISLANILDIVLQILYWLVLIRALVSWVNPDPFNPIVQFLYKATEWMLEPIRRIMPAGLRFGLDISPLIAFLLILFMKSFLVRTIYELAVRIKN